VYQTEKTLKEAGANLGPAEKAAVEKALNELKEALKNENITKEQLESKMQSLTQASHKLAEAMYKNAQSAGSGASSSSKETKKDDDVIDAEVE